ncbi:AraC family transcriptional regulator [Photobacterium sp. NCIMB 13483]|uniref:HTH-type transcriptional repressor of iron proteins A n=1 Tax=Photobacterium piscicola TaxID=1378299 RepID=A0A1T5HYB4_9GAMM|nr:MULTISPECIES: helix-turn-helix transcriptional regulator [Photobacterium]PST86515.1 AraC family transcriptional regulator [Photobacterium sp. NCIMB 13483]SKC31696.1 HTH-type transcriptional repressor of iron proteins A [Photobacterium piscicola]
MTIIYNPIIDNNNPPDDIFFVHEVFEPDTSTLYHSHYWGQLHLVTNGIIELSTHNNRFLAPPRYALWIPAMIEHKSYIRRSLNYCSMNVCSPLSDQLPAYPCLLEVTDVITAIIEDLRQRQIMVATTEQDKRLITVLFDQVLLCKEHDQFLPTSEDKLLQPILIELEHNPTNNLSLTQWAQQLHTTERTLARHYKNKLGISFTEWRQRRKFIYALHLLRQGMSVNETALTLGYHQASPFITLFKKYAGATPDQYRLRLD